MFPQRLKQLRLEKGMNQTRLAQEMGVSQGTVARWETDVREPDNVMLRKLAEFFGVSIDYLLKDEHTPEMRLITRISKLSEADKNKMFDAMNEYLKEIEDE
jgi:transcriptional regulator with XRE-family HTH domain